ncbi:MAG TPA: phosphoribosyltransferase family protein [Burkholderiaceae bacterium]|nr:phosphoribosyltransferase family protein [Burkholderiaceae bacterium]
MEDMMFNDRREAGRELASRVAALGLESPVVLALPRGGVPVAAEVARALNAPLDLLLVRKIGAPFQPELAVAAVADGPQQELVIDEEILGLTGATHDYVEREAEEERAEIARRRTAYLCDRSRVPVKGRPVVLVDDGIATGTTMKAALKALQRMKPARLVLAVPVAPSDTLQALRPEVDDIVCVMVPPFFRAVGCHYVDFHQVDDDEVIEALRQAGERAA